MTAQPRKQTGIRKGEDGWFKTWCRICPKRSNASLPVGQQIGTRHGNAQEALRQAQQHRKSDLHQDTVIRLASPVPNQEEILLAKIFGCDAPEPCKTCGVFHSHKLSCITAARVRDNEGLV